MSNSITISVYSKAINLLTSQEKFHINLGLERTQKILALIGNPHKKLEFIHVAGTNGKGSVCAMLSAILVENKVKTGLFTSPHIFEYTERIKVDNSEISKEQFGQKIVNIVEIAGKNNIHLTEFEILTVVAFEYFAENNVDIVILETGLGGRLDSTNVIEKNICSVITNIHFDHTERLGSTIEKIAQEKAGIIKTNSPVVISGKNLGFNTIRQIAEKRNSQIFAAEKVPNFLLENLALKGTYQKENLGLVLGAINILNKKGFEVSKDIIIKGLKKISHPCRFEYIKEKNLIIDAAHNPSGIKVLKESLELYFPNRKIKFIFGCLRNKNYKDMLNILFPPASNKENPKTFIPEIYFYQFNNKNSCSYQDLASVCNYPSKTFEKFKEDKNTLTVICGSFYMIEEVLEKMVGK